MLFKHMKKAVTITCVAALISISAVYTYAEEPNNVTVTASILNLRESPNTSSKILDKLTKGKQLKVIDSSNGWCKVTENGLTGWVSADYVTNSILQSKPIQSGTIKGSSVNIRKGPGLTYNVITQLKKGEKLDILEESGSWVKTKTTDDIIGWVSSSYIEKGTTSAQIEHPKTPEPENSDINNSSTKPESQNSNQNDSIKTPEPETGIPDNSIATPESDVGSGNDSVAGEIIEYAKSFLGIKYTYGGTTPESGFDCSGFTQYTFEKFGINLNRVAADQANQGVEVSKEELLPGDLVFSDTDGGNNNITHVGIYIGDGLFINAASGSTTGKVVISDLNSSYWQKTYMVARRVI